MNNQIVVCVFGSIDRNKYTHYRMRTLPLIEEFKKKIKYCFFNPSEKIINEYLNFKFILIQIKFKKIPKLFLKIKNKLVIWDIIDSLPNTTPKSIFKNKLFQNNYKNSDIINFPNSKMKLCVKKNNPLNRKLIFIPHNWDSRMKKHINSHCQETLSLKKPTIAYVGTPNTKDEKEIIKQVKDVDFLGPVIKKNHIGKFNILCSFRDKKNSFWKPATKSYVSASFDALIIAHKHEYGVFDLFGEEYPYYIKNSEKTIVENIKKTIDFIKDSYKTEIWFKAIEITKNVKELTCIENIANEFIEIMI